MTAATDLDSLVSRLDTVAREAGAELRRRFDQPRQIEKKGVIDLVTDADRAAEAIILRRLAEYFPGSHVLAEESGSIGPRDGAIQFVVDPLDGTTNYAHGIPHFSTTIAAIDSAGVVAGVTYDPLRNQMYSARRGGGAWCDGQQLHVSATVTLDDATLATGFPYDVRDRADEILGFFSDLLRTSQAIRRFGSAALDLAWIAQGRFDGYWERGLKPWDMATGILLVTEAGGVVSDYRGDAIRMERGECLAATPGLHPRMVEVLRRRIG